MIPNLYMVAPRIWRGGQPSTPEDWLHLKVLGVGQVIKLNEDSEATDDLPDGMQLFKVQIPLSEQLITEPDLQYLRDAVEFIRPGTFVHCRHGRDRTGLVIGLYRVLKQDWTKERAYSEMLAFDFHAEELGLSKAWQDFTKDLP